MKPLVMIGVVLIASGALARAQEEKKVPKDSERVTLQGCSKGRTFIVGERTEHVPSSSTIEPGRRFRLSGSKEVLNDIKKREGTKVAVTGIVKKSDIAGPGGVKIAGGRVRIGGAVPATPTGDPANAPQYYQAVFDVEAFETLPESCSLK